MARKKADTLPALQARIDQFLNDRISSLMGQVKSIRSISDQIASLDTQIAVQETRKDAAKNSQAKKEIDDTIAPLASLRAGLISELADLTKILEEN